MMMPLLREASLTLVAISTRCLLAHTKARDAAMRAMPISTLTPIRHLTGADIPYRAFMQLRKLLILLLCLL